MAEVSTLYKAALKVIVEDKLVVHPVDVRNQIPPMIYEDVWKVTAFKNLQEVKRDVIGTIALLEKIIPQNIHIDFKVQESLFGLIPDTFLLLWRT